MQHVQRNDWLEHVQFKIALARRKLHRGIVAKHLHAHHGHAFALSWIHLARHNAAARLVLRNRKFANAAARTAGKPAHIICNFHKRSGQHRKRAVRLRHGLMPSKRGEFILCAGKWNFCFRRKLLGNQFAKSFGSVQAGAHRGTANSQVAHARQTFLQASNCKIKLRHIAGKFLAQCQRHRVLQMRAPHFHNAGKFHGLGMQRVAQLHNGRQHRALNLYRRGDMHGGWKSVIAGLRQIHVVIWVHGLLATARAASQFNSAVRNHLVDIHVGLRARTGLPHLQWKLAIKFAGRNFMRRANNQRAQFI